MESESLYYASEEEKEQLSRLLISFYPAESFRDIRMYKSALKYCFSIFPKSIIEKTIEIVICKDICIPPIPEIYQILKDVYEGTPPQISFNWEEFYNDCKPPSLWSSIFNDEHRDD